MKTTLNTLILFLVLFLMSSCSSDQYKPSPSGGTLVKEDMEIPGKGDARRAWIESMHRSAEEDQWKQQGDFIYQPTFQYDQHGNYTDDNQRQGWITS